MMHQDNLKIDQSSATNSGVLTNLPAAKRARSRRGKASVGDAGSTLPALRYIKVDEIDLPRRPARRVLGDIASLAESMQEYGLQQPISVRANAERFMLTSGLRRIHAARALGWTTIMAFVRTVSADDAYLLDLIENLQREDLAPDEEADALGELIRTRGWTMQQVATGVKRSIAYVSKRVRIFEDLYLRDAVVNRGLAVSTAEELLAADPGVRPMLVDRAVTEHWDQTRVREVLRTDEDSPPDIRGRQSELAPRSDASAAMTLGADQMGETEPSRPRGFTRAVREFHRLITPIQAQDLTAADRVALRALFRDLVMLARASSIASPRVFPPLPPNKGSRGR